MEDLEEESASLFPLSETTQIRLVYTAKDFAEYQRWEDPILHSRTRESMAMSKTPLHETSLSDDAMIARRTRCPLFYLSEFEQAGQAVSALDKTQETTPRAGIYFFRRTEIYTTDSVLIFTGLFSDICQSRNSTTCPAEFSIRPRGLSWPCVDLFTLCLNLSSVVT